MTGIIGGALDRLSQRPADKPDSFRWIESPQELEELASALDQQSSFALDSESNSGFAYEETLCLLQVNVDDQLWLVDLLAIPGDSDSLEPLRRIFEDPDVRVCLHGGEFDVGCLKRDYDIGLKGVWDSQQAASYLGWEKTGYGAVVERVLGIRLPKEHAHYDWSRRPIEGAVLQYALNDVRYLPAACRTLHDEVEQAGLEEEVGIACRAVEASIWNGGYQPVGFWNLKGGGKIPSESKPLLFSLYQWRDLVGRQLDLPAGRALNTELLLALARNPPSNMRELNRIGLPKRISADLCTDLLQVVASARRCSPVLPERPIREGLTRVQQKRGDRLKSWRRQEAERRQVPLQVVMPLAALKHLQREGAEDLESIPQLGSKRIRLYGDQLQSICRP